MIELKVKRIVGKADRPAVLSLGKLVAMGKTAELCQKIMRLAMSTVPVDTGKLRGSHQLRDNIGRSQIKATITATAPYAMAVHDGTGPHVIKAKRGKLLRFTVGGRTIYTRSVNHPGNRPNPWLARAAEQSSISMGFTFKREESR